MTESRGRTRQNKALHISGGETMAGPNSPNTRPHGSSEGDSCNGGSAEHEQPPKAVKAALGSFFESAYGRESQRKLVLGDADDQSRGAYSTVSKMQKAASKKSSRSSTEPKDRKAAKDVLGSFLDHYETKEQEPKGEGDDDQSRGAYSTMSKMRRSKSKSKSSSGSRSVSRSGSGSASASRSSQSVSGNSGSERKDRLRSRKPSSPLKKKSETSALGSLLHHDGGPDDETEEDIEVRSAYAGTGTPTRERKKKVVQQPVAGREANVPTSKEELMALFRSVSSTSDYVMTDEIRNNVVATATNLSSRIASVDKDTGVRSIEGSIVEDNQEPGTPGEGKSNSSIETGDRSIATLIKIAKARSQHTKAAPASEKRKTQTTSRTMEKLLNNSTGQRQSPTKSKQSPSKNRTRSKSRSSRSKRTSTPSTPSKKSRSKSRSRRNSEESTSDVIKSPRPKSRSRRNSDDVIKSPRPKSRSRRNSDERSISDAIKTPEQRLRRSARGSVPSSGHSVSSKDNGRRHRDEVPRQKSSRRLVEKEDEVPRQKSSRRLAEKEDEVPRQKSSRRLADKDGVSPPQRQKSSRRLADKEGASPPQRQRSSRRLADKEDEVPRQKSSRRLADKDGVSPPQRQKSSRRFADKEDEVPRQKSSRRLGDKEGVSPPQRQRSSRHPVAKDSPKKPVRSKHEESEATPRRSKHSGSRRSSNDEPADPALSASTDSPKQSNHQKQMERLVIDAPILEEEVEQPVQYIEQDIFSVYTWSLAQSDTQRIQKERQILKDSLRDSPLFRVFPHQRIQSL
jgi:hypothetical protein